MKKNKTLYILLAIVLLLLLWGVTSYNSFVSKDEAVTTAWSDVQTQYQRRSDLIPNLVNTVKGYATHEQATLEGVVQARAKATQMTVDPEKLTPEAMRQWEEAQGAVAGAIGRLLAVAENYPDLKANENFLELQSQLEGTENRIGESRRLYNQAVQNYNQSVRRLPGSIIASLCGFEKKIKFEAAQGSDKAPEVSFE